MRTARHLLSLLLLAVVVLLADAAGVGAQTDPSSTTVVAPLAPSAVTTEGSPTDTGGLLVFLGVCAVIVVGAAVLIVRQRRAVAGRSTNR